MLDIYQESLFYVYAHLRNKDSKIAKSGTPYYIGKGSGDRAWSNNRFSPLPIDKNNIIIIAENLTEINAFKLEIELISFYGRKDLGTGILNNRSNGGEEGVAGKSKETLDKWRESRKGYKHSEETRKKLRNWRNLLTEEENAELIKKQLNTRGQMSDKTKLLLSIANLGKIIPNDVRKKMSEGQRKRAKEKPATKETREKMSNSSKGRPKSEEHRKKLSIISSNITDETRKKYSLAKKGKIHFRVKVSLITESGCTAQIIFFRKGGIANSNIAINGAIL